MIQSLNIDFLYWRHVDLEDLVIFGCQPKDLLTLFAFGIKPSDSNWKLGVIISSRLIVRLFVHLISIFLISPNLIATRGILIASLWAKQFELPVDFN